MKKFSFSAIFSRDARRGANFAPKSASLRLEALENRELLDAASLISENAFPLPDTAELLNSHLLVDDAPSDAPIDLSSVETLESNAATTWVVSSTDDDVSVAGTLRHAIANAQDGDTIKFDPSLDGQTITIADDGGGYNRFLILNSISIIGEDVGGAPVRVTLDGNGQSSIMQIDGRNAYDDEFGVEVTIKGLNLANGSWFYHGGGIFADDAKLVLEDVLIDNCHSGTSQIGGGLSLWRSEATLKNVVVSNCSAYQGGGIYLSNKSAENAPPTALTAANCLIVSNTAEMGGGIMICGDNTSLYNCTVANNDTPMYGGGIIVSASAESTTKLYDTIVAGNVAEAYPEYADAISGYGVFEAYNTLSSFTGWTNADAEGVVNYVYDPNLPLFADAANGDYQLTSPSQAKDLGDNSYVTTELDLAGAPRSVNGVVDLGAYEYQGVQQLPRPALTATKTAKTITLNWDAIPHAKSYTITYRQMGTETPLTLTYGATKTSCTARDLEPSKSYYFTIRANGDGIDYTDSAQSPTITVKTNALQQLTRPAITPGAISASTIEVTWAAIDNAKSYTLSYAPRSSNPVYQTATLGANKTSYTLRNLEPNRSYYVKICANGDGLEYTASQQSPTVTIATRPFQRLDRPELAVVATTENSISVSWGTIANATSYKISYAVKATEPVYTTVTYGASKTNCVIRNLDPNTSYYVKIQAIGDGLEYQSSQQSPTQTAKTFAATSGALLDAAFKELFEDAFEEFELELA